jgi:ABC-type oligopeptide transport system substrate-binding subunit
MGKKLKIILGIFAVLILLSAIAPFFTSSGYRSYETEPTGQTISKETEQPQKSLPSETPSQSSVTINNIDYRVTEVIALPMVGGMYYKEADGIFVIITLEIKNNAKDAFYLTSNDFKLKDYKGRTYSVDSSSIVYLKTMYYDPLIYKKLGPDLLTEGSIVFDVPEDDRELILEIEGRGIIPETKTVVIGDVSNLK